MKKFEIKCRENGLDIHTIQLVKNLADAMNKLNNRWHELSDNEAELLSEEYPFKSCFNELTSDVDVWYEHLVEQNKNR